MAPHARVLTARQPAGNVIGLDWSQYVPPPGAVSTQAPANPTPATQPLPPPLAPPPAPAPKPPAAPAAAPPPSVRPAPSPPPAAPRAAPAPSPTLRGSPTLAPKPAPASSPTPMQTPRGSTPSPRPKPAPAAAPAPALARLPPRPAPPAPGTAAAALTAHNSLRARHGAPPLAWDPSLASAAARVAAACDTSAPRPASTGLLAGRGYPDWQAVTTAWYQSGAGSYDYTSPGPQADTSMFVQVVWAATARLGCAAGEACGRRFHVCLYAPPRGELQDWLNGGRGRAHGRALLYLSAVPQQMSQPGLQPLHAPSAHAHPLRTWHASRQALCPVPHATAGSGGSWAENVKPPSAAVTGGRRRLVQAVATAYYPVAAPAAPLASGWQPAAARGPVPPPVYLAPQWRPTQAAARMLALPDGGVAAGFALQNELRARHGAPPLAWDAGLAADAAGYIAGCPMSHSRQWADRGENLAWGFPTFADAVTAWYAEVRPAWRGGPRVVPVPGLPSAPRLGWGQRACPACRPLFGCIASSGNRPRSSIPFAPPPPRSRLVPHVVPPARLPPDRRLQLHQAGL